MLRRIDAPTELLFLDQGELNEYVSHRCLRTTRSQCTPRGAHAGRIVLAAAVLLFDGFGAALDGFLATNNLLTLLRSVSVLGILGLAMVIVVIGRGIDLSLVANMAISVAWTFQLMNQGVPWLESLALGLGFALLMSLVTGCLVAYAEIPPCLRRWRWARSSTGSDGPG